MKALIAGLIILSSIAGTTVSAWANYFGNDTATKQGQLVESPVFGPAEKGGI